MPPSPDKNVARPFHRIEPTNTDTSNKASERSHKRRTKVSPIYEIDTSELPQIYPFSPTEQPLIHESVNTDQLASYNVTEPLAPDRRTDQLPDHTSGVPPRLPILRAKSTGALISSPLPPPNTYPASTTRKLPMEHANLTTRQLTFIPAAGKRTRVLPTVPRTHQHRPIRLLGAIIGSLLVLVFAAISVAPLNNGQHGQGIVQQLGNIFLSNSQQSFDVPQHIATPIATPALMTTEGYCGGGDIWGTCATSVTASGTMGTGTMQAPLIGAIVTQPFAHPEYQQWCGCTKPHSGIDLAATYGTAITAADSGQVIWTGWDWSGLGWAVKINHGHYIATVYGHMARYIVKVGQDVTKGQVIGYEGSTGASTGPHLHFMVVINNKWVDPTTYVNLP